MTGTGNRDEARDLEAAARWAALAALGDLDAEQAAARASWLSGGPERALMLAEAEAGYSATETALALALAQARADTRRARAEPPGLRALARGLDALGRLVGTPGRMAGAAGGLAVAAVLAVVLVPALTSTPSPDDGRVRLAEPQADPLVRELALADGSQVVLARGAVLEPVFSDTERRVRLLSGEAVFDVAHDAARPFVVEAGPVQARVLGTRFNVSQWSGGVSVTVLDGEVGWAANGAPATRLGAGEGVAVLADGRANPFEVELSAYADWRSGWVSASRMPLGEIIEKLDRDGDVGVSLAPDVPAYAPVSGRFRLSQSEDTVQSLAALYGLRVERIDGALRLSVDGER